MQTYELTLTSNPSISYHCSRAANSLDIDLESKLKHYIKIDADITTAFNIGLIVGSSGSGKTSLAKHIWGENCFKQLLDQEKPILDQFTPEYSYNERVKILTSVGLNSVPCWIRPVKTLSNGQKFRAEIALQVANKDSLTIIDEWTSVVDRTIAKVMSHSIQVHARSHYRSIVLLSCHYDVIDWLKPDWVIDCNKQTFKNRRSVRRKRKEKLTFDVRECPRRTWKYFSKYHYLSSNLPGGKLYTYGLYHESNQIGFICYAYYVAGRSDCVHFNRLVIHPDYIGLGLGKHLLDKTVPIMLNKGLRVMGKFSSAPVHKILSKDPNWVIKNIKRVFINKKSGRDTFRTRVKAYCYEYEGPKQSTSQ